MKINIWKVVNEIAWLKGKKFLTLDIDFWKENLSIFEKYEIISRNLDYLQIFLKEIDFDYFFVNHTFYKKTKNL